MPQKADPEMAERPAGHLNRRTLIAGGAALALGGAAVGGVAWWRSTLPSMAGGHLLSPPEAHEAARVGDILLVDIRRPDEWAETGVGTTARALDMRRQDFIPELLAMTGEDTAAPIALICARGVRSRHLAAELDAAGFTHIHDVPEGMLGSAAGPGWLARGLPVVPWPA